MHKRKNKKSIHEMLEPYVVTKHKRIIKDIERDEKGRWIVKE